MCCIDTKRPVIFTAVNWICGSLSPTSRSLADGLAQKVQGLLRTCHTIVLGQWTILVFSKLTTPKLGEENPAETLKIPPFKKWLIFFIKLSEFLTPPRSTEGLFLCVLGNIPPSKKKRIMILFFSCWFCLWCLWFFWCYLAHFRFSLPFNSFVLLLFSYTLNPDHFPLPPLLPVPLHTPLLSPRSTPPLLSFKNKIAVLPVISIEHGITSCN